jgi:hypothetical protein
MQPSEQFTEVRAARRFDEGVLDRYLSEHLQRDRKPCGFSSSTGTIKPHLSAERVRRRLPTEVAR